MNLAKTPHKHITYSHLTKNNNPHLSKHTFVPFYPLQIPLITPTYFEYLKYKKKKKQSKQSKYKTSLRFFVLKKKILKNFKIIEKKNLWKRKCENHQWWQRTKYWFLFCVNFLFVLCFFLQYSVDKILSTSEKFDDVIVIAIIIC